MNSKTNNLQVKRKFRQYFFYALLFVLFLISRWYIYSHPPYTGIRPDDALYVPGYSDVKYDYERYAKMWHSGHPPYFKHAYEYFPATIPLLYLPQIIDHQLSIDYYPVYRTQTALFDALLFLVILAVFYRSRVKPKFQILAAIFYLLLPIATVNYWYEGIDLVFIGTLVFSLSTLILFTSQTLIIRFLLWFFFWLSTSLKLISTPLVFALLATKEKSFSWRKEILISAFSFFLIWGIPALIFRTSLSVPFVLLSNRHIKYASVPSVVVESINAITKTETYVSEPPDFYWSGPYSSSISTLSSIAYPLVIVLLGLYGAKKVFFINNRDDRFFWLIKLTFSLVLATFLTGKVFSQPFHIWNIPLITLLLLKPNLKVLLVSLLAVWLVLFDTTTLWNPEFYEGQTILFIPAPLFRHYLRVIPMIIMFITSLFLLRETRTST